MLKGDAVPSVFTRLLQQAEHFVKLLFIFLIDCVVRKRQHEILERQQRVVQV
jgi:hypothetical protein